MRQVFLCLLVFVTAILVGCSPTERALTGADREIARKAIDENTAEFIAAAEAADAARLYATLRDVHGLGFINNGRIYPPQDSLLNAFEDVFSHIDSQTIEFTDSRVWVISPAAAVSTNLGHGTTTDSEGIVSNYEFIWTFVYQRLDDDWKIVHSHLSFRG